MCMKKLQGRYTNRVWNTGVAIAVVGCWYGGHCLSNLLTIERLHLAFAFTFGLLGSFVGIWLWRR
jgi:hypothetical protein